MPISMRAKVNAQNRKIIQTRIMNKEFQRFKVCQCKHCGRYGITESNFRFKCFQCNKLMNLKKVGELDFNIKIHSSYDDARVAGEVVRKLNEEVANG